MSEDRIEIYRQLRTAQEKYTYFMLAAAGACVAFAVTKTQDATLSRHQLLLAGAVICWAASFFAGAMELRNVAKVLFDNRLLIDVQEGVDPITGTDPLKQMIISEFLREQLRRKSGRAELWANIQFCLLIFGAFLYLAWHVFEMYLRTRYPAA